MDREAAYENLVLVLQCRRRCRCGDGELSRDASRLASLDQRKTQVENLSFSHISQRERGEKGAGHGGREGESIRKDRIGTRLVAPFNSCCVKGSKAPTAAEAAVSLSPYLLLFSTFLLLLSPLAFAFPQLEKPPK